MTDLVQWLTEQIDQDEWWAREASRPRDGVAPPEGVRWHWVDGNTDEVLSVDPVLGDALNDGGSAELRSVEEFPSRSVGTLPLFAVPYAQEVPTVVAGHIVRHDPARVLRQVAAYRRRLERYKTALVALDAAQGTALAGATRLSLRLRREAVLDDASVYADRPGFDPSWTVE